VWFPAIEDNITRLNGHSHNGSDSVALSSLAFTKFSSTIASGDWVDGGNGNYSYQVTVPAGIQGASAPFNDINYYQLQFYITSTGVRIYPGVTRNSSTTFTVSINDNSVGVTVLYV